MLSSFLVDGVVELQRRITCRGANSFSPVGETGEGFVGENWRSACQFVNRELRKLGVEDGPRVGTRVEVAEEGRGEGEEGL